MAPKKKSVKSVNKIIKKIQIRPENKENIQENKQFGKWTFRRLLPSDFCKPTECLYTIEEMMADVFKVETYLWCGFSGLKKIN